MRHHSLCGVAALGDVQHHRPTGLPKRGLPCLDIATAAVLRRQHRQPPAAADDGLTRDLADYNRAFGLITAGGEGRIRAALSEA